MALPVLVATLTPRKHLLVVLACILMLRAKWGLMVLLFGLQSPLAPPSSSSQFVPNATVTLVGRSGKASNLWRAVPLLARKRDPGSDMQVVQTKLEIQVPCMCLGDCPGSRFQSQGNMWLKTRVPQTCSCHLLSKLASWWIMMDVRWVTVRIPLPAIFPWNSGTRWQQLRLLPGRSDPGWGNFLGDQCLPVPWSEFVPLLPANPYGILVMFS